MKKTLLTILFALVAMMMPSGLWAQDATITGVTITVDGVEYGTGETAVITPNTTSIIVTVTGENLGNATNDNFVQYGPCLGERLNSSAWTIDVENNVATTERISELQYF